MTKEQIKRRVDELLAKVPTGTVCTEDNCMGGYLTQAEADELAYLLDLERRQNESKAGA